MSSVGAAYLTSRTGTGESSRTLLETEPSTQDFSLLSPLHPIMIRSQASSVATRTMRRGTYSLRSLFSSYLTFDSFSLFSARRSS